MECDRRPPVQGWEGYLEDILDSLDEGVLTLRSDGRVIGINRAACEILETTKQESLQLGCPCLLGEQACDAGSNLRRSISEQRPMPDFDLVLHTPSGRRKVLRLRTAVFRSAARTQNGGVVMFRDVTELSQLRADLKQRYRLESIIGKSKAMQDVFDLIEQVANSDASVLIEGPTGTGKELVARAIHHMSRRAPGPFVAVNCSALPESLLESELFGHVRGAFTGAIRDKRGRFEAASSGSIFLDEIGDISAAIQVKLLRVLQERTVERIGNEKSIRVDIRVIAATNRPLQQMIAAGQFRSDLYYRLRVVPIRLPSLAERRDDISLLVEHFIQKFREETGRPIEGVEPEAMSALIGHNWPGNVRELENVIEYAFVRAQHGRIGLQHLPAELLACESPACEVPEYVTTAGHKLLPAANLSRRHVHDALTRHGWNIAKAARQLGVSRTTLYKRMDTYGLAKPEESV